MKQSLTKSIQSEVSACGVALQRVISVPAVIEDVRSAFFGLCVHAGVQVAIQDERVNQLLTETDIRQIAVALDRELDAPLVP